jgi:hypothetical protein
LIAIRSVCADCSLPELFFGCIGLDLALNNFLHIPMAAPQQVKEYLAYWFQLGKRLKFDDGHSLLPQPILAGDRYSSEFEACWQEVLASGGVHCYLEGTAQSVADLLSGRWDLQGCARCGMPVPLLVLGVQDNACPCADLPNWPNSELPQPRLPVDSRSQLEHIQARLMQNQTHP